MIDRKKNGNKHVLLTLSLFSCSVLRAQTDSTALDSSCVQKELGDVIRVAFNKPPKASDNNPGSALLLPIIGSNPATGFMIGIGGQYGFKLTGKETRYSLISGSVQFTTKNQQLFLLKNNIYTRNNRIFLNGDWRYLIFSQPTYGLGTNSPQGGIIDQQINLGGQETSTDSLAQPLKFNFIRLYQSASFGIFPEKKGLFVGFGYGLDMYSKIVDEKLRLDPNDSLITSHYAYNTAYGFNTSKYAVSSFNLNLVSDTRDNMINPYSGHLLLIQFRGSPKFLGNSTNSGFINAEWRSFHKLSLKNPRHLIAFWGLGQFTPEGKYPYLTLPATAYDQRSRSARGYTQGRFRGNNMVYGETEYRFPLSPCGGVLGGVVFVNATTANNAERSLDLFESVRPGYGFGLRVMVDKKTRTNLAIDIGVGEKSVGFYLAASETF
jgi:outer membrane protein assembly factor BamA